jgi:hypothetical protein
MNTSDYETTRSFEPLTKTDLAHLGYVAKNVFETKIIATPIGRLYFDRLIMFALCQGAAKHYVDQRHGIKDLDVWAFFDAGPKSPFPYRSRWVADFGASHLGRHPDDGGYDGRRVDVVGRSIPTDQFADGAEAIRAWLHGRSSSASYLIRRPIIGLYPEQYFDVRVWLPSANNV